MTESDLRFPIGSLQDWLPQMWPSRDREALMAAAQRMQAAALDWHNLLAPLTPQELARTYRPGSFTVSELAHHTADAHLHGLNRLRYALTTPEYVIQPFDQEAWLTLPDATLPVSAALELLDVVNQRWAALLRAVDVAQFDRRITHPAEGPQDLWQLIAKHDWHVAHHLGHARIALGQSI